MSSIEIEPLATPPTASIRPPGSKSLTNRALIVAALAEKNIPHAAIYFEGEQHGFRRAENIVRSLEAELWFYGRVFGFEPADPIEPIEGAVGL